VLQTVALDLSGTGQDTSEPFPAVTICVLMAHVALIAVRHTWQVAVGAWWTFAGVSVLLVTLAGVDDKLTPYDLGSGSLIALISGIAYRHRQRIRAELAVAQRDVEIEQERRTLVEERARIARELHDVVAHSMSVIHMQATSAPYRLPDVDPGTRAEFASMSDEVRPQDRFGVELHLAGVNPGRECCPGKLSRRGG
jgi:signal transduction histidine kinase